MYNMIIQIQRRKKKKKYILCTGGKFKVIQKGFIIIIDSSKEKLH